ncbi:MAG: hypothetical protein AAF581_04405 [Planctomycetota bacterium]
MRFAKYWAAGSADVVKEEHAPTPTTWQVRCYGASDRSVDEAKRRAAEIAQRMARSISTGRIPNAYDYGDNPLREEVLEEFRHGSAAPFAVVTRNSYGSAVLNCSEALFADIDYAAPSLVGGLKRLFLGRRAQRSGDDAVIDRVRSIAEESGIGVRLYRTANGFRCLVTSRTYDPTSDEARQLLERCGSDPLYMKLCKAQQCFRARLTPKFWRCGATRPPGRIPFETPEDETRYREWEGAYEQQAAEYSTCAFVGAFGSEAIDEAVQPVVDMHDRLACGDMSLA